MIEPAEKASAAVRELGSFIREQRKAAQLSLRNLASQAGVSNPYLSQIERGLRKPSAEILQSIARALRISAESLYVRAGILEEREDDLAERILADASLSESQKRALLEVYLSFRQESGHDSAPESGHEPGPGSGQESGPGSGQEPREVAAAAAEEAES